MLLMAVTRNLRTPGIHHGSASDEQYREEYQALKKTGVRGNRCHYCYVGFGHEDQFELIHDNDDHADMTPGNLKMGCPLCHAVKHLDLQSSKMDDPGSIIWLPEMSQAQLNQLFWAIVHHHNDGLLGEVSPDELKNKQFSYSGMALYIQLASRAKRVPEKIQGVSNLAHLLKKVNDAAYQRRGEWMKHLRYLPPMEYYQESIKKGSGYSFNRINPAIWPTLLESKPA